MQRWPWRASAGAAIPTVLTVAPSEPAARPSQERPYEPETDSPAITPARLALLEPGAVNESITAPLPPLAIVERTGGRLIVRTNSGRAPAEGDGWYVMDGDRLRPAVPYEVMSFAARHWDLVAPGSECALGVFAA